MNCASILTYHLAPLANWHSTQAACLADVTRAPHEQATEDSMANTRNHWFPKSFASRTKAEAILRLQGEAQNILLLNEKMVPEDFTVGLRHEENI